MKEQEKNERRTREERNNVVQRKGEREVSAKRQGRKEKEQPVKCSALCRSDPSFTQTDFSNTSIVHLITLIEELFWSLDTSHSYTKSHHCLILIGQSFYSCMVWCVTNHLATEEHSIRRLTHVKRIILFNLFLRFVSFSFFLSFLLVPDLCV